MGAGQEKIEEAKQDLQTSAETENTILGSGVVADQPVTPNITTKSTMDVISGVTKDGKTIIAESHVKGNIDAAAAGKIANATQNAAENAANSGTGNIHESCAKQQSKLGDAVTSAASNQSHAR